MTKSLKLNMKKLLIGVLSGGMVLAGIGFGAKFTKPAEEIKNTFKVKGEYTFVKRTETTAKDFSATRYLKSIDKSKVLLATAFNSDVLALADGKSAAIGYVVNDVTHSGTTYYEGISTKSADEAVAKVWTAADIFGEAYTGYYLIVDEIDFDRAQVYEIDAFFDVEDVNQRKNEVTIPVNYAYTNLWDCKTFTSTEEEPYLIETAYDLAKLRDVSHTGTAENPVTFAGQYFKLANDISMWATWNKAIGANGSTSTFKGTFDGDNHTISNFKIKKTNGCTGLFGNAVDATIKNVKLSNIELEATSTDVGTAQRVAGIVGRGERVTITNCHILSGTVKGVQENAGICGVIVNGGTITNCSNAAAITTTKGACGGILGDNYSGVTVITGCTNSGTITGGPDGVGGIVGQAIASRKTVDQYISIKSCINNGKVSGTSGNGTGGIIGCNNSGCYFEVEDCESNGDVTTAGGYAGGVVGVMRTAYATAGASAVTTCCSISNVIVRGNISYTGAATEIGWIAGRNRGIIKNCKAVSTVTVQGVAASLSNIYKVSDSGSSVTGCEIITE